MAERKRRIAPTDATPDHSAVYATSDQVAMQDLLKDMEEDAKTRVEGAPILHYLIRLTKLLIAQREASP